jgi:hypothetical protein
MQAHRQLDARARHGSLSESLLPAFANEQALSVRPALRSREGRPSYRSHVCFAAIFAWFAILFTGRYPPSGFEFVEGVIRWHNRVAPTRFS